MHTSGEAFEFFDVRPRPKRSFEIRGASAFSAPEENTICFVSKWKEGFEATVNDNPSTLFLVPVDCLPSEAFDNAIPVENARLAYAQIVSAFFASGRTPGIASTAVVEEGCSIGADVHLAHGVVVESGAVLGDGCTIGPNTVVYGCVRLGKNVTVGANTTLGGSGFGLERDSDGRPFRIPHMGGLIIGNDVEIGSSCTVVRGTINDTVIENEVQTDDQVHVAHNVHLRRGSFLTAGVVLSGSVDVGARSWLAPGSVIINGARIGEEVMLGLGAVVVGDVSPGSLAVGVPAKVRGRNPQAAPVETRGEHGAL